MSRPDGQGHTPKECPCPSGTTTQSYGDCFAVRSCANPLTLPKLTYMSIRGGVQARLDAAIQCGELTELVPLLPGTMARRVIMTPEVSVLVEYPSPDTLEGEKAMVLRGNLDGFVLGKRLKVARKALMKDPGAELAPVAPESKGVWDFRVYHDEGALRCFGCFVAKDVFLAISVEERDGLNFDQERESCLTCWWNLFAPYAPIYSASRNQAGVNLDDYLSQPFTAS